jgi:hypothetical protein
MFLCHTRRGITLFRKDIATITILSNANISEKEEWNACIGNVHFKYHDFSRFYKLAHWFAGFLAQIPVPFFRFKGVSTGMFDRAMVHTGLGGR